MMRDRQGWLRVVLALAIVGVAVLVRKALVPVMGLNVPYVTVYPAIMIVAVVFGTGPGVLAALVGIVLAEYQFMRPQSAIAWDLSLAVRSMIVLGASLYIGRIGQKLRAARAQAETEAGLARAAEQALRQQVALVDSARAEIIVREMQRVLLARRAAVVPLAVPTGDAARRVSMVAGVGVASVGMLALCGWAFDVAMFTRIWPGLTTMKANTALCFVLTGLAVAGRVSSAWRTAAAAVGALAALSLAEYAIRVDLGIDQLLFHDAGDPHTIPGRMAQVTAVSFVLASLALLLADARARTARWAQQGAALAVAASGFIAVLGYVYNVRPLYGPAGLASMALLTAAAFVTLGIGLLFMRPDTFARVLSAPGPGGQMARRILPGALLLPAVLGWLHEVGEKVGLFAPSVGAGLFALAMIGSLGALIWWAAHALERADEVRREFEAQLRSQTELMNHSSEALIVREMDGAIRFWNRGAETLYGWPAGEALGQRIHVLLRTEGLPPDHETRLAQTGHWEGKLVHTSRDGRQVTVESRKTAVRAADGSVLVLESNRDISDRERAETALRESEERLRFALETSHTGAWDLDLVNHTAYRSFEHDRIFGYASLLPHWTYEMFLEHVLPEDRAMVDGKFRGAMETNGDWSFECRIRRPDGQVRWIWAAGRHRPDAAGAPRIMAGIVQDITDRKAAEEALRESETRVRRKLDSVLSPEGDLGALDLGDILDAPAIQALMDHFYKLAHIPMSIIDCQGRLLVGVGWQDVCMRFHRAHPVACRNCVESDLKLSAGVPPGQARLYKCKNGMWDMATPIMVGDRHVGNIFTGQFFFDDEPLDTDLFRAQARQFGFQQDEYLAAVEAVPRLSRDQANTGMAFLTKLADILSRLGCSNVKLARILVERDALLAVIQEREQQLRRAQEIAHLGSWELDLVNNRLSWSDEVYRIFGLQPQEFAATYEAFLERIHPDDRAAVDDAYAGAIRENRDCYEIEHRVIRKDTGEVRTVHEKCEHFRDAEGRIVRSVGMVHDISERKLSEAALAAAHRQIQSIIDNTPAIVYALDLEERFLLANATLAKVLHCMPEQMIGKRRHEFMPKNDADRHEANDRQVIESGKALELEEYSQLPDRSIVWLTTKFPLRDAQNRIYAVAGISADITARKAAEAEIQRQIKALQAANEELARFNRVAVDRELRMVQLKRQVNELCEKAGQPHRYKLEFMDKSQ